MSVKSDHSAIRDEPATTFYDGIIKIPGIGDPPNRCRGYDPIGFCANGHTLLGRSSCGCRYCPDHWRDWNEEAIKPIVKRLAAFRAAQDGAEKRLLRVVASPPQDQKYSVRDFWNMRSEAYDVLESAGARGGVCVPHGYRTSDRADELYETAVEHGEIDQDYGKWRFIREISDGWDDLSGLIEASPHYHGLVPATDFRGDRVPDGWIAENIGSFGRFDIDDPACYEEMAGHAYYILSHGSVQDGKSTTTYFGDIHPAAFNPEEELTREEYLTIERMVEQVVGQDSHSGEDDDECPHDDCHAVVHDWTALDNALDDDEWVDHVRDQEDGAARLAQLRGLRVLIYGGERPPPPVHDDKQRMLDWLKKRGQEVARTPKTPWNSQSTTQDTFDTEIVWGD